MQRFILRSIDHFQKLVVGETTEAANYLTLNFLASPSKMSRSPVISRISNTGRVPSILECGEPSTRGLLLRTVFQTAGKSNNVSAAVTLSRLDLDQGIGPFGLGDGKCRRRELAISRATALSWYAGERIFRKFGLLCLKLISWLRVPRGNDLNGAGDCWTSR